MRSPANVPAPFQRVNQPRHGSPADDQPGGNLVGRILVDGISDQAWELPLFSV